MFNLTEGILIQDGVCISVFLGILGVIFKGGSWLYKLISGKVTDI